MSKHEIGNISEFEEGKGKKVNIDGIEIAVFNLNGELFGIQNMCPHKQLPLHIIGQDRYYSTELIEEGWYDPDDLDIKQDETIRGGIQNDPPAIYCPWHYLEFDLETGENDLTNKCISTYDVEVDNETVLLTI